MTTMGWSLIEKKVNWRKCFRLMGLWEIKLFIEEGSGRDYSKVQHMSQNDWAKLGEVW